MSNALYEKEIDGECFEIAMENGNYSKWVEAYPAHIWVIFGALISGTDEMKTTDIEFFKGRGLNIDTPVEGVYYCDSNYTNALGHACEFRKLRLMELLLQAGADVNLAVPLTAGNTDTYTPLDTAIMGHNHATDYKGMEDCIRLLTRFGARHEVFASILMLESLESYTKKEAGEFLNKFFRSIPMRLPKTSRVMSDVVQPVIPCEKVWACWSSTVHKCDLRCTHPNANICAAVPPIMSSCSFGVFWKKNTARERIQNTAINVALRTSRTLRLKIGLDSREMYLIGEMPNYSCYGMMERKIE